MFEEMVDLKHVRTLFRPLKRHLDERTRRLVAAAESEAIGRGGISAVSSATGISRRVIRLGRKELRARSTPPEGRLRRPGGGHGRMKFGFEVLSPGDRRRHDGYLKMGYAESGDMALLVAVGGVGFELMRDLRMRHRAHVRFQEKMQVFFSLVPACWRMK